MDTENSVVEIVGQKPFLVESRLYVMNAENKYMEFLEAELLNKMQVETILSEAFPREDSDADHTRIFVSFTNKNDNGTTFKIVDPERLERRFDIDHFFNGYLSSVNEGMTEGMVLQLIPQTLATCLQTSATNALGVTEENMKEKTKIFSTNVLSALVAVLLNDPLDAILILKEGDPVGDQEAEVSLVGFWTVTTRD